MTPQTRLQTGRLSSFTVVWLMQLSAVTLGALSVVAAVLNPTLVRDHPWLFGVMLLLSTTAFVHVLWYRRQTLIQFFAHPTQWNLRHTIGLVMMVIVIFSSLQFRLGQAQFYEDEFQVMNTAAGLLYTDTLYQWDWRYQASGRETLCADLTIHCHYTRAVPHTWLIEQSYLWFGVSEWSTRLPSVLGGVATGLLLFGLWYSLTRRYSIAFIIALLVPLLPELLGIFRTGRMYALLIPVTLGLWWAVLVWWQRWTSTAATSVIQTTWKYRFQRWWPLLTAAALAALGTSLHSLMIIVVASTWCGVMALLLVTRRFRTSLNLLVVSQTLFAAGLCVWFFVLDRPMSELFGWLDQPHWRYLGYATGQLVNWQFGLLALVVAVGLWAIRSLPDTLRLGLVFQFVTTACALLCFVFFLQRYTSFNYSVVFTVLTCGLIMFGVMLMAIALQSPLRYVFVLGSALLFFITQQPAWSTSYRINPDTPDLRTSYQTIHQLFQPSDALFGQYLRWYYLQGLPPAIEYRDMGFQKTYTFDQFMIDQSPFERFWVTWETRKAYHLVPAIKQWVAANCTHYHGKGIDRTNVEVYYCQKIDKNF